MNLRAVVVALLLSVVVASHMAAVIEPAELKLAVGQGTKLKSAAGDTSPPQWTSTDPATAVVYANGFVVALKPGQASIKLGNDVCRVHVTTDDESIRPLSSIQQFKDNRESTTNGRKWVGSELNGKVLGEKRANRVANPHPLIKEEPVEWEVQVGAPVVDGAGTPIGTVSDPKKTDDGRRIHTAKFNYGMTKVIHGKLFVYAFVIRVKPDAKARANMAAESIKSGTINTSAWLPIDAVVEKELLLELIGVGEGKLPHLPLGNTKFRITGGNPNFYDTNVGEELSIVENVNFGAHPSDYLRRPSGTVNVLYSVPGFDLGGQALDSFLIGSGVIFKPVKGARSFIMPTYYPPKHPLKGKMAEKTQTFLYGAVETPGSETIYGWVAKEALAPAAER